MRYITLGGSRYPIQATMALEIDTQRRWNAAVLAARERAEDDADAKGLDEEARERLIARRVRAAQEGFRADAENSLLVICALINGAVERERELYGRDIRDEVPIYPVTAQKLAVVASVADLNDADNARAIAEEVAEGRSGAEKNVMAGQMMEIARGLMTRS